MTQPFLAADVGNARIKLGLFAGAGDARLPEPLDTLPLAGEEWDGERIAAWLAATESRLPKGTPSPRRWWIASVNRPAATRLIDWIKDHRPADRITLVASGDVPVEVRLPRPDMVGIDRLVDALAVNRLRDAARPAVIADVGTAITVDLVSTDGAFLGGAILPGIQMGARALHEFTDLLPLVDVSDLTDPPPALGTATVPAIESGIFWGAVGSIRQLIVQLGKCDASGATMVRPQGATAGLPSSAEGTVGQAHRAAREPQVFLTGGAGAAVARLLGDEARHVPNLTLSGIALAAIEEERRSCCKSCC